MSSAVMYNMSKFNQCQDNLQSELLVATEVVVRDSFLKADLSHVPLALPDGRSVQPGWIGQSEGHDADQRRSCCSCC